MVSVRQPIPIPVESPRCSLYATVGSGAEAQKEMWPPERPRVTSLDVWRDRPHTDSPPGTMTFTHTLRVRYDECDIQGIVHNSRYLAYASVTCMEWWREMAGSSAAAVRAGLEWVLAEATVRYLAPLRVDELVEIALRVARLGKSSLHVDMSFARSGETVATADLHYVLVDPVTLRPLPVTGSWREVIERYSANPELSPPSS